MYIYTYKCVRDCEHDGLRVGGCVRESKKIILFIKILLCLITEQIYLEIF